MDKDIFAEIGRWVGNESERKRVVERASRESSTKNEENQQEIEE